MSSKWNHFILWLNEGLYKRLLNTWAQCLVETSTFDIIIDNTDYWIKAPRFLEFVSLVPFRVLWWISETLCTPVYHIKTNQQISTLLCSYFFITNSHRQAELTSKTTFVQAALEASQADELVLGQVTSFVDQLNSASGQSNNQSSPLILAQVFQPRDHLLQDLYTCLPTSAILSPCPFPQYRLLACFCNTVSYLIALCENHLYALLTHFYWKFLALYCLCQVFLSCYLSQNWMTW